jgi:hypothetical protein
MAAHSESIDIGFGNVGFGAMGMTVCWFSYLYYTLFFVFFFLLAAASFSLENTIRSFLIIFSQCICSLLQAFYGAPMPAEGALELLQGVQSAHAAQQAVLGTNAVIHIDTAEIYKTGNMMVDSEEDVYNEQMLAPFLASVPRESFTIATKLLPHKYGGSKSLEICICT